MKLKKVGLEFVSLDDHILFVDILNYKSINQSQQTILNLTQYDIVKKEIREKTEIEDILDFDFDDFNKYCMFFHNFYESGDSKNFKSIVLLMIRFFSSNKEKFDNHDFNMIYFIEIFQKNNTIEIFSNILQNNNSDLLGIVLDFVSLLSSLNPEICEFIASHNGLLDEIYPKFINFEDKHIFENSLILFNNLIRYYNGQLFLNDKIISTIYEKIGDFAINDHISMNLAITFVLYFDVPPLNIPNIKKIILNSLHNRQFFDSLTLIFIISKKFPDLIHFFIQEIFPVLFHQAQFIQESQSFILFFKLFSLIISLNHNLFKDQILNVFNWGIMEKSFKFNSDKVVNEVFVFLINCYPCSYERLQSCFPSLNDFVLFLIETMNNGKLYMKETCIRFISLFIKEYPISLQYFLDDGFIDTCINLMECDVIGNNLIIMNFLKNLAEIPMTKYPIIKDFFNALIQTDLINILENLSLSEEEEVSSLAEYIIDYFHRFYYYDNNDNLVFD
ncbi:hypothetical protein TRFO_21857 [Tritrichomonas foetus]|uniref:Uncharacterized protein n=1 Tax=Tritrichomonas foetus TaxID=1144522 RepID=A0A1J4KE59_9EUKA|nr:hypothetical protein TRFO_21857 [Tritrichomonas foetus]|eukprot:OHT09290.1 hypothetical protein TRFO_21857 [Tritrichomonas foetus]